MAGNSAGGYSSPGAFRTALTARLKNLAETSRWQLPQLQRQVAYDRLLVRLYLQDGGWIVKGAIALLARDLGVRATNDIDVFRQVSRETAEAELRQAASQDIGDWFRFEIERGSSAGDGSEATRLPVAAYRVDGMAEVSHRPYRRKPPHDGRDRGRPAARSARNAEHRAAWLSRVPAGRPHRRLYRPRVVPYVMSVRACDLDVAGSFTDRVWNVCHVPESVRRTNGTVRSGRRLACPAD